MFAVLYERFGPPDVLALGEAPEPHAGPGQVRIRVRAAGVSPVDLAIRAGTSPAMRKLPHIPGVDAAGVVDEGAAPPGQEVFGSVELARLGGATAEFAVLDFWAPKPAAMSWEEAGGASSSVETATRALDLLGVTEGMTLLIDGATGGVGSVAVQLAVARGARVIGTGRAETQDFLAGLGAEPVGYGPDLASRVHTADRALDIAGKGSLPDLIAITGDAANVVTIADFSGPQLGVRLSVGVLGGQPHGRHGLTRVTSIPVHAVFPFAEAARAHALPGLRQGKIVLVP